MISAQSRRALPDFDTREAERSKNLTLQKNACTVVDGSHVEPLFADAVPPRGKAHHHSSIDGGPTKREAVEDEKVVDDAGKPTKEAARLVDFGGRSELHLRDADQLSHRGSPC